MNSGLVPDRIETEAQLEEALSTPSADLVKFTRTLTSPLMVLGAGGKMGPSLAALARKAADAAGHNLEVVAVSRFSNPEAKRWLEEQKITTISCDLLERTEVERLPNSNHVIYLPGLKFGTSQNPAATWAINTIVPAQVAMRYAKAQIVAMSTGNVYPLSPYQKGGSVETDRLAPAGEYGSAAMARERIFEFYAHRQATRLVILRLFYATELWYGVLPEIARKVLSGEPIDLANSYFNCIWLRDANEMIIRALGLATYPPVVYNLCRPEIFSLRDTAAEIGEILGCAPVFKERDHSTALLGNAQKITNTLGVPPTDIDAMKRWAAQWVKAGGRDLGKPTHFEVRDGVF